MINGFKERMAGYAGSISGAASVLGSWQVCHSVCLALIAVLSAIGITIVGMPLEFLTQIAVPLWSIAAALLLVSIIIYVKRKCISQQLLFFNGGLLIAGVPFSAAIQFLPYLWSVGGTVSVLGIVLFVKKEYNKRKIRKREKEDGRGFLDSNGFLLSIIFGIAVGVIIIFLINTEQTTERINNLKNLEIIATGSTDEADVLIELTPESIRNGKLTVNLSANTHSVDLSKFDLTKITTLEYAGKTVAPVSAPSMSGHHVSGELVFQVVEESLERFQITIRGIPAKEERTYIWSTED